MTKIDLCDDYVKLGSRLISKDVQLILSERQKSTLRKTKYFLLKVNQDNTRTYISSLYPVKPNVSYTFDYKGVNYVMSISDEKVTIGTV